MSIVNRRYLALKNDQYFDFYKFSRKEIKLNLLVIGAMKCGTTSMHQMLDCHPNIYMSKPMKEPGFFMPFKIMKDYYQQKGIALKNKYHLFNNFILSKYANQKIVGESSTYYSTFDVDLKSLPQEILKYNSEMKYLYIIRNPLDRIVSHFFHEKDKKSDLSINDFIANDRNVLFISDYKTIMQNYLKAVNVKSFKIVVFENFVKNSSEVINSIFQFLDVKKQSKIKLKHLNKKSKLKEIDVLKEEIKKEHLLKIEQLKIEQQNYFKAKFNLDLSIWK